MRKSCFCKSATRFPCGSFTVTGTRTSVACTMILLAGACFVLAVFCRAAVAGCEAAPLWAGKHAGNSKIAAKNATSLFIFSPCPMVNSRDRDITASYRRAHTHPIAPKAHRTIRDEEPQELYNAFPSIKLEIAGCGGGIYGTRRPGASNLDARIRSGVGCGGSVAAADSGANPGKKAGTAEAIAGRGCDACACKPGAPVRDGARQAWRDRPKSRDAGLPRLRGWQGTEDCVFLEGHDRSADACHDDRYQRKPGASFRRGKRNGVAIFARHFAQERPCHGDFI